MPWKSILLSVIFIVLGIWFVHNEIVLWNRRDLDKMLPARRLLGLAGSVLLIIVGILYLLDSIGMLH